MKNKLRNAIWLLLATFIVVGVAIPIARQNSLNRRMLEAIQLHEGASTIQDLIHEGADPNAVVTNEYDTPIFRAVNLGSPETVQVLLKAGASVQRVGPAKMGPIFAIAFDSPWADKVTEADCRAIIKQLQNRGESIEERDVLGFTPLMRAVWSGNTVATKTLLNLGANTHVVNNYGQTVWYWTDRIPPKQSELVKLLREHDAGIHRS